MTNVFRQFCSLLMLFALLTASALPAGFMPNLARAGGGDTGLAPLVLCTAAGFQTVYVPKDQAPVNQDTPADETHQTHPPCPYAPVHAAADLPVLPAIKAPFVYHAVKVIYTAAQNLRTKLPQKHIRSQAPPRL